MKSRVFAEFESYDRAEYAAAIVKNRIDVDRITVSGGEKDGDGISNFSNIPVFNSSANAIGVVCSPRFSEEPQNENEESVYVCIKADDGQAKRAASMLRNLGAISVKITQVPL